MGCKGEEFNAKAQRRQGKSRVQTRNRSRGGLVEHNISLPTLRHCALAPWRYIPLLAPGDLHQQLRHYIADRHQAVRAVQVVAEFGLGRDSQGLVQRGDHVAGD